MRQQADESEQVERSRPCQNRKWGSQLPSPNPNATGKESLGTTLRTKMQDHHVDHAVDLRKESLFAVADVDHDGTIDEGEFGQACVLSTATQGPKSEGEKVRGARG